MVHAMLNVALDTEELKHHVPAVWGSLMKENDAVSIVGSNSRQIINSAMRYPMHNRIQKLFPQALRSIRDCAATDPALARTFDNTVGKNLRVGVRDNARTILQKRPDVAIPPQLAQLIEQNNGINLSLNELKEMSRSEFDQLHAAIDDMQETLVEIDANQRVVVDWINDQEKQKAVQALAAAKAAEAQLTMAAFRSSVSILSTLTGFLDPEFGEDFAVIGNAALDIGTAVQGLMTASAGLSALGDIASLGTVVMTGNVLGAVMNVVSLFGDNGPSPEQMILEEIGKLRQEVNQLRGEMHDRFDRIDEELNTIYMGMMERFDLIDIQLGKINGKLDAIQESLVALDLRLSRLERNTFEMIDAVGRRPLLAAINGGLGYQERTGLPMPYQPEFVEFENTLHTWGTINVFDALAIGPSQRNYSPDALLAELNTYPMDANLNYLNGWLKANGMPGIANKVIASPRDWMLAARAYAQLGSEWPEHMQRIDPERQAQLDAVGADIEMAMQNIAALTTATGTVGNELLYTTVISYYQNTLDRVDRRIQPLETIYVQEVQAQRLERAEPFNLYGGIDQPLTFQPPGLATMFYVMSYGEDGALSAPANLKVQISGLNRYTLAEYFAISPTQQIDMVMSAAVLNPQPAPGCTPDPDTCPVIGDLEVLVRVSFGNVPLAQMELHAGRVTLPVIGGDVEDPTSYTARNWAALRPRFERDATPVPLTPDETAQRARLYGDLAVLLENRLAGYQQEMYNRILTELNTGSLRQPAAELAGGKALLDQLVTVGLVRAMSGDDFLRSMLYGNQRLVDDNQVLQTYALSRTQPITGTNLLVNPRLALSQVADQRSAAFAKIVDGYLDAITAQTHSESLDHIASARRELELTIRIAQVELEQASNYAAGHAAYLKADCPAAVLLFDLVLSGGGFGGANSDAAKLAGEAKAECVAWQTALEAHRSSDVGAALAGYAALLETNPQTPLRPLVQSQMESLFGESESLAGLAGAELCQQFQTLRVQELVPAKAGALPALLWACGQVFEDEDVPGRAVELYAQLLNDYPDHALAQETTPALARATVAQARAAGAGNIPAPQSVGGTGSGPAVVVIQNASPEKISLVFNGPESRLEELAACADCDRYSGDGPAACPEQGSVGVYELPAGGYTVVVNSSSDKGVIPFIGQWNLNQGEEYHSCFFLVTTAQ